MHKKVEVKSKAVRWFLVVLGCIAIMAVTLTLNEAFAWPMWPGIGLMVAFFFVVTKPKKRGKEE